VKKILIDYVTLSDIIVKHRTKNSENNIKLVIYVYHRMNSYYENLAKIVISIIK
jgi:hypothetical protein